MARPLRIQFPGAHYHITCRGIERRAIFLNDGDRARFLNLLERSLKTYRVVLHAYALMLNHFHLLIQTEKANCAEFMRHFNICYTGWFNWRHKRNGNLYQGRYKAYLIDADSYLLEVSRYLHLNPVRVQTLRSRGYRTQWSSACSYRWSSLPGYVDEKRQDSLVEYTMVLSMAGGRHAYREFVKDGLKRELENPFKHVACRNILGDMGFVSRVKGFIKRSCLREQPSYRELQSPSLEPARLLRIITHDCGIDANLLRERHRNGPLRGMVAELLYRYCDITQAQIGLLLGEIDYISVHMLRKRLQSRLATNPKLRAQFKKLEAKIKSEMYNVKI
jgi:REP element-mobilizing transposase RayT